MICAVKTEVWDLPEKGRLKKGDRITVRPMGTTFIVNHPYVPFQTVDKTNLETHCEFVTNAVEIVYWHDRHTRSWVVQALDIDGNQIDDADFSGTKIGRDHAVKAFKTKYNCPVIRHK